MKRPAQLSLLVALLLGLGTWVAIAGSSRLASAPVSAEDAGLTADVWAMPERSVPAFLSKRGVEVTHEYEPGTAVVGRVSWTPLRGAQDQRFTILLGDQDGGAGSVSEVLGLKDVDVALGNGSMWDATTKAHDWLRGSGTLRTQSGYTEYGTFASVPTDWAGDVWFVGHVLDVSGVLSGTTATPRPADHPTPVVGVALSTADRVWWVRKLASA